jgi:hypothetical protein
MAPSSIASSIAKACLMAISPFGSVGAGDRLPSFRRKAATIESSRERKKQ